MILQNITLLLLCISFAICSDLKDIAGNDILHYLNSNSEQIYRYKNIKSLEILNKENDFFDIKTTIEVECLQDEDSPCLTKSFSCEGKLQYKERSNDFEVISVFCNPEDVEELKSEDEIIDTTTEDVLATEAEVEASSSTETSFCTGCAVDLNLDVEGLPILLNTAVKHLETERDNIQSVVEVLRLQRQIVAGVKYRLIFKVAPTVCLKGALEVTPTKCPIIPEAPVEYCDVKYIEQPWISRDKNIISNNCTKSQEFTIKKELDTNTIDSNGGKSEFKASENDIPPERLASMESQVIPHVPTQGSPTKNEDVGGHLSDSLKSFIDGYFDTPLLTAEKGSNTDDVKTEAVEEVSTTLQPDSSSSEESGEHANSKDSSEEDSIERKHVSLKEKRERLRRALKQDTSEETSEDSKTSEENRPVQRNKRDTSEETTETSEETTDKTGRSISETSEEKEPKRRNKRDTSEESDSDSTSENLKGKKNKRHVAASDTESSDTTEEEGNRRNKRKVDNNDNSSSSSSSSSSSDDDDDDNNNEVYNKKQTERIQKENDDDDDSSSSSSSSSDDNNNNRDRNRRHKRSTELSDVEEKVLVRNLAELAIATLDQNNNDNVKHVILNVVNNQKTPLEGTIYNLKVKTAKSKCKKDNVDYYTRDLLKYYPSKDDECAKNIKEKSIKTCEVQVHITEDYTSPKLLKMECNRNKREVMPGAPSNATVDDPKIVELAHSTLTLLDGKSEHNYKYKVVEIIWASKQVVSGVKYRMGVKVTLSDCLKTDSTPAKECAIRTGSNVENCDITIWDQPWLPQGRKTSISCGDKGAQTFRTRRSVPTRPLGGVEEVSVSDPDILDLIEFTLSQLDDESSLEEKYKATEILSATRQLVAGVLYKIEAKIVPTTCLKTEDTARELCDNAKESSPQLCTIKIWDRPWLPNGRQTNVTCNQATYTYRSKRSVARPFGENDFDIELSVFKDFKEQFGKVYANKREEMRRFRIFRKNLAKIETLNANEKGTAVYGITKFSDLTYAEFKQKYTGLRRDLHNENEIPFPKAVIPNIELPVEFDWRTKGAVTEVKDQQQCGSCWAFSVTGNVEGQYAIKHKKLIELSEQELVDCDKYDDGCEGGLMDNAYRAIEQIGGLELENDYPYDAEDETCHYNNTLFRVQLSGAVNISQNEDDMAKWLTENGPISIAINANAMQFYFGGVSHPLKFLCDPKDLDHGVLIVGYGVHTYPLFKKTLPFWIVKNSWGKNWGEQGYYRVYRGDGTCGLNQTPSSSIVV